MLHHYVYYKYLYFIFRIFDENHDNLEYYEVDDNGGRHNFQYAAGMVEINRLLH